MDEYTGGTEGLELESFEHIIVASQIRCIDVSASQGRTLLITVELPIGLREIRGNAFNHCMSLVNVALPSTVQVIGEKAFYSCFALEEMTIPHGVLELPNRTFASCGLLHTVRLPETVVTIGDKAFSDCANLCIIELPPRLQKIGNRSFYKCKKMESLLIPSTVISIGESAFASCNALESVEIYTKENRALKKIGRNAFDGCQLLINIGIPKNRSLVVRELRLDNTRFGDEKNLILQLQERFEGLPLHERCYNQGHDGHKIESTTIRTISHDSMVKGDMCGLTPFHILALSEKAQSINTFHLLKGSVPANVIQRCLWHKDHDGHLPLRYLINSTRQHSQLLARLMVHEMIALRLDYLEQGKKEILRMIEDESRLLDWNVVHDIFRVLSMNERKESIALLLLTLWKGKLVSEGLQSADESYHGRPRKRPRVLQKLVEARNWQHTPDRWDCYLRSGGDVFVDNILSFLGPPTPELQLPV